LVESKIGIESEARKNISLVQMPTNTICVTQIQCMLCERVEAGAEIGQASDLNVVNQNGYSDG
jgi:hypothetical protein